MKNLTFKNIELLNLNEMLNVRGGDKTNDTTIDDGHDGDVIIWQ